MIICVVYVVLMVELVVICGCCDYYVHGEILEVLEACGRLHDGGGVVVFVVMYIMWMLC